MKKALSVIIALTLIFSIPSAAFAAEFGDIVYTDFEGDTETYKYAGTLKEGNNYIEILKPDKYKIFTPEKSGVYSFGSEAMFFIPESVSESKASGYIESPYTFEKEYFFFEAGEPQYIFFYGADESNVNTENCAIEYVGEPEELICKSESVTLIGQNIFYDEESDIYYIDYVFELTFTDTGEKVDVYSAETKTPIKSGDNTVEIEMLGKTFNINLNVRNIGEYIKEFELPENYTDTGYLLYNGNVIGKYPKYVTVFYTDGSSERLSVRNDGLIEIDIPGLRIINTAISFDEGNMIINIADKDYELGAFAKKAGAFLNTIELISSIRKDILGSISFVVMLSFLGDFEAASDEIRYLRESIADEIRMYKAAL